MSVAFKLYELSDHISQIQTMLENGEEGLEDTLEALELSFEEKAESIIKLWHSKMAEAEVIKSEENRLADRRKRIEKEAEWLHQYVEREMKRLDRERIKSPLFTISLQKNPPSVSIFDESAIPSEYFNIKEVKSIDKRIILDQLKAGFEIPGAEIKQERRLSIR